MRKKLFRSWKGYWSFLRVIIPKEINKRMSIMLYLSLCFPLFFMLIDIISENYGISWLQTYLTVKNPLVYPFIIASSGTFFGLLFIILSLVVYIKKDKFFKEEPKFEKGLKFGEICKKLIFKRFGNANAIIMFYSISIISYYLFLLSYSALYNLEIESTQISVLVLELFIIGGTFLFSVIILVWFFHSHYCILLPFQNSHGTKYAVMLEFLAFLILTSPPMIRIYMLSKINISSYWIASLIGPSIAAIVGKLLSNYLSEKKRHKLTESPNTYPFNNVRDFYSYRFFVSLNIFPIFLFIFILSLTTSNIISINWFNYQPKILFSFVFLFIVVIFAFPMLLSSIFYNILISFSYTSGIANIIWRWGEYFRFSEVEESENKFNSSPVVKRTGICIAHSYDPQYLEVNKCQEYILLFREIQNKSVTIPVLKLEIDNPFINSCDKKIMEGTKITVFGRPRLVFDKQLKIKPMIEAFNIEYASGREEGDIHSTVNKRGEVMEKLGIKGF